MTMPVSFVRFLLGCLCNSRKSMEDGREPITDLPASRALSSLQGLVVTTENKMLITLPMYCDIYTESKYKRSEGRGLLILK
jgi:hypothetical protein